MGEKPYKNNLYYHRKFNFQGIESYGFGDIPIDKTIITIVHFSGIKVVIKLIKRFP